MGTNEPGVSSNFPLAVPCPGAPFAPGPFGWVPPLRRYYDALRRPSAPLSLRLRSRLAVASRRRSTRDLLSPRRPSPHVPRLFDPGETSGAGLRERRPYAWLLRCCLPSLLSRRLPRLSHFGVQFRPRARCLASWPRLPSSPRKTRFRLAALPWPGGNSTRWVTQSGFSSCGRHIASSWSRLSWRTQGRERGSRRRRRQAVHTQRRTRYGG
jgi:hypothetical protein